jgi:hypothetical protein
MLNRNNTAQSFWQSKLGHAALASIAAMVLMIALTSQIMPGAAQRCWPGQHDDPDQRSYGNRMSNHDPLGPERKAPATDAPAHPEHPAQGRLSRLDEEIEALRRSPTPTQTRGQTTAAERAASFLDGVAFMGIFSRTRDIIAANFNDMLDKADDPAKMIRMIILEMEETLVEVRASAARTIADQKEMHRHCVKLDRLQADWAEKAQLCAVEGPRGSRPRRIGREEEGGRHGR